MLKVFKTSAKLSIAAAALVSVMGLNGCASVNTERLSADHYILTEQVDSTVITFESLALNQQADQMCPKGFDIVSSSALKSGAFVSDESQCLSGSNCEYQLQWRIQCVDKVEQPFSIFGKI